MHHPHCLAAVEGLLPGVRWVKLVHPRPLEVERIEQVTHGEGIEFILLQHLLDHALRVVAAPLVDHVAGLPVVEVAALWLGIVELVGFLHERWLKLVALTLVHENGIGD